LEKPEQAEEGHMKKLTLAILALFAFSIAATAQTSQDQSAKGGGSETTVQGCLSHSGNGYTLTDKSDTTYHLTGDTSKLTEHVGHEVEIRGMTSSSGEASGASSAETKAAEGQQLEVSGVMHISATCTSGTGTEKSPDNSPMNEKPPMSENPPTPHR
jgi:hypothetical protein